MISYPPIMTQQQAHEEIMAMPPGLTPDQKLVEIRRLIRKYSLLASYDHLAFGVFTVAAGIASEDPAYWSITAQIFFEEMMGTMEERSAAGERMSEELSEQLSVAAALVLVPMEAMEGVSLVKGMDTRAKHRPVTFSNN